MAVGPTSAERKRAAPRRALSLAPRAGGSRTGARRRSIAECARCRTRVEAEATPTSAVVWRSPALSSARRAGCSILVVVSSTAARALPQRLAAARAFRTCAAAPVHCPTRSPRATLGPAPSPNATQAGAIATVTRATDARSTSPPMPTTVVHAVACAAMPTAPRSATGSASSAHATPTTTTATETLPTVVRPTREPIHRTAVRAVPSALCRTQANRGVRREIASC